MHASVPPPPPSHSQPPPPPSQQAANDAVTFEGDSYGDFVEQRAFDPRAGAARRGKLTRANLLLVGLFAIGAASVYFLSLRKGPARADARDQAVETQIDSYISKAKDAPAGANTSPEGRQIVEAFYDDITRHQVPLEDLKGNPFVFGGSGAAPAPVEVPKATSAEELARLKRKAEVEVEFGKLKLQSIMMSQRGGTAIINNTFVTEGETVGSFKVAKINSRSVVLLWENVPYTLQIEG